MPGTLSDQGKPCHATGAVDRDPYVVGFGRPLALDPYAHELALCVEVAAGGEVAQVIVVQGSGDARTDRATVGWLRALRFEPALREGRAVASWRRMTIGHGWPYSPPPP